MADSTRYDIGAIAALAGVSRRTVRYYVQEKLIPPPLGVGRGDHYSDEHLDHIRRVKALQESGRTLDDIRRLLTGKGRARLAAAAPEPVSERLDRSLWQRIVVAPGVELHVASEARLPSPAKLRELAHWCRLHFGIPTNPHHNDGDQDE